MTELHLVDTDPAELNVDAVVIGVYRRDDADEPLLLASGGESVAAAFSDRPGGGLIATLHRLGATGAAGEVTKLASFGAVNAPIVAAVGLGTEPTGAAVPAETLRRGAGSAVRALAGCGRVALALPLSDREHTDEDAHPETAAAVRAIAEGALLGAYRFAGYRTKADPTRRTPVGTVVVQVPEADDAAFGSDVRRAGTVTSAVAQARDWVNAAPNELRPPAFADAVAARAREAGLEVTVLDEDALREGGFGGILAVGCGSAAPPRLVRLAYRPERFDQRIALVGKGITFDTGGVSIKPAQGMWDMKSDMAGAAAVAATMLAIAALAPQVAVTAYLPMAENMPSGSAYRPGDVVKMRSGKHVEVVNTDAEGRMILADAMAWACEEGTDILLETSTLTGGQVISLGRRVAGVMGSTQLCERVKQVGDLVGEPVWPMPLPEDVRSGMESEVADISQTHATMDRAGHMVQGGIFLSEFVTDDVSWAHIDIAGPAFHTGEPTGYWSKGGTGVPVRTLVTIIEQIAADSPA